MSGKIKEEINKKGWFANKNQIQAIVEQENFETEIVEQSEEKNSGIAVQDSSVSTQTVDTSNWDLTKVNIVYDTANVAVPVPKGYVASGADGEHTVNTGFVIYEGDTAVTTDNAWDESCTRNQWVWVPVPDVSRIYEVDENGKKKGKSYLYSSRLTERRVNTFFVEPGILSEYDNEQYFAKNKLQGITREKFLHEMQEEFDFTIESIKKYGGFYIGRYETGNLSSKIPVVQRMNTDIYKQAWYTGYSRLQRLGTSENVKSNIIWGCLWDETLQWLIDSGNKTYEEICSAGSWGNNCGNTFEYKDTSENTVTKTVDTSWFIPSGSTEYTKANNIYDMVGNVDDNTLVCSTSSRVAKGTNFKSSATSTYTSAGAGQGIVPYQLDSYAGFRAYLYIR